MTAENPSNGVPPPGLHWVIVLLLGIVTVGLFLDVWMIVQAVWVRKFHRSSQALNLVLASILLSILGGILDLLHATVPVQALIQIATLALVLFSAFSIRDSLSEYITNVQHHPAYLSGLMTIFFGPVYLQYHMNRVRSFQRAASLAGAH